MKNISFGLVRIFGMIGFLVFGIGSFYKLSEWFGLDISTIFISEFGGKDIILLVVSILMGLVGMLIGQGIGASIPVRSDKVSNVIDIIWHYGANGSVIWVVLSMVSMSVSLGKEASIVLVLSVGTLEFTFVLFLMALIMSWAIALQMYVVAEFFARMGMREFAALLAKALPIVTCIFVGIVQSMLFGISILWGIVIGVIAPFLIIPLSIHTKMEDYRRRKETKSHLN